MEVIDINYPRYGGAIVYKNNISTVRGRHCIQKTIYPWYGGTIVYKNNISTVRGHHCIQKQYIHGTGVPLYTKTIHPIPYIPLFESNTACSG